PPSPAAEQAAVAAVSSPTPNIMIGNMFYGTEGWMAMSDGGYQVYKGESGELIDEGRPERGQPGGGTTGLHM
ncbi:MAG TPA: hypothetical protein VKJ01_24920, partial [Candidatus Solibacter sp.]|nr:hypothetical protein [Candidatus Solibacter sp.]